VFTLVQLSDLHCGTQFFLPNLLERAIAEVNELVPDVVIVSGDLTTHGFKDEYMLAKRYLDTIECESIVVIPGNHDSRNVGYVHFEELFGERNSVLRCNGVAIVAVDSTEPDLDNGQIGRGRYRWIEEQFAEPADLRVFVLHHHLLPVPGTGRERNIVNDAGDTIECLQRAGVDLVLAGHKHVPYAWKLEDLFVVNAGEHVSTLDGVAFPHPDFQNAAGGFRGHGRIVAFNAAAEHNEVAGDARVREIASPDKEGGDPQDE